MRKRKAKAKNKRVNKTNKSEKLHCEKYFNQLKNKHIALKTIAVNKNKTLVLFLGAGAAKAWNGPLCGDIDPIIRNNTTYVTRTNNTPIGEYIFQKLEKFYGTSDVVNFETFLGALEGMLDFVLAQSNEGGISPGNTSFSPSYLNFQDWIEEIKDYRVADNGNGKVYLYFPRESDSCENVDVEIVDRVYFSELFKHYYKLVANAIEGYVFDIKNEKYSTLNKSLVKFISYYQSCGYRIRVYTTNYDRLFPNIVRDKYKVFDGFNLNDEDDYSRGYGYNINKILKDRNCLCHYNLHGCIYWHKLFNEEYDFWLKPFEVSKEIEFTDLQPTNPNQIIIPINIVTGYNKLQRISLDPLSAMYNAFLYDCNRADLLITVGYSFSDYHLNRILKHAIKPNKNQDYHISYQPDPTAFIESKEFYPLQEMYNNDYGSYRAEDDWVISSKGDNRKKVYLNGFDKFLLNEEWNNIII